MIHLWITKSLTNSLFIMKYLQTSPYMPMKTILKALLCLVLLGISTSGVAQTGFEQRRNAMVDTVLTNNNNAIILQAYRGLPVNVTELNRLVEEVPTRSTADFSITRLIRILFFSYDSIAGQGPYDSLILPMLDTIPFWLTFDDDLRSYWSENHWCMWNSSNWLLHEQYGRPIDSTLEFRLRHYLRMKVDYGFYEFYSPVYAPFTLRGLLNLADFAKDTEIRQLATIAAYRLLSELLLAVNDKGVFLPAAGRAGHGNYQRSNNLSAIIYLLTGLNEQPDGADDFLSTTSVPMDTVVNSWSPQENLVLNIGHSIDTSFILNQDLSDFDRVLYQWSGGGYLHPSFASESAYLIDDYDLWGHPDLEFFATFSSFSPQIITSLANSVPAVSQGSVIMQQDMSIFKSNSVTLSSVEDFWKGGLGFQQFSIMANVGTSAIYTASGEVKRNWNDRTGINNNTHLPYVKQQGKFALVMYWQEPILRNLGDFGFDQLSYPEVSLRWEDADFDETDEIGNWITGRQENGYVAVYRHCLDTIMGIRACSDTMGQTWAYVVGDSSMYGSYTAFKDRITQAIVEADQYVDNVTSEIVFYSKVVFDGDSIEYEWRRPGTTGIADAEDAKGYKIYPNPATTQFIIDLSTLPHPLQRLQVVDLTGRTVFKMPLNSQQQVSVVTDNWPSGLYFTTVHTAKGAITRKLIIE